MAMIPVTHKPLAGAARQFDGTLDSFLDILNARPKTGLSATCRFDEAGAFVALYLTGPGVSVSLGIGDWVIFPTDPARPAVALSNTQALAEWQA